RRCRRRAIRATRATRPRRARCSRTCRRDDGGSRVSTGGWILGGVRTPFAKAGGPFRRVPVYQLGPMAVGELIARSGVDPAKIDEVTLGNCAMPAEAANSARVTALRAGVPESVPAATVHRNCASGMESVADACYRIAAGDAKRVISGGM